MSIITYRMNTFHQLFSNLSRQQLLLFFFLS